MVWRIRRSLLAIKAREKGRILVAQKSLERGIEKKDLNMQA
jgi:hypothetical protein